MKKKICWFIISLVCFCSFFVYTSSTILRLISWSRFNLIFQSSLLFLETERINTFLFQSKGERKKQSIFIAYNLFLLLLTYVFRINFELFDELFICLISKMKLNKINVENALTFLSIFWTIQIKKIIMNSNWREGAFMHFVCCKNTPAKAISSHWMQYYFK